MNRNDTGNWCGGKRGEATPRGSGRGVLFEGLLFRLNLLAFAGPVFRGNLFAVFVGYFLDSSRVSTSSPRLFQYFAEISSPSL